MNGIISNAVIPQHAKKIRAGIENTLDIPAVMSEIKAETTNSALNVFSWGGPSEIRARSPNQAITNKVSVIIMYLFIVLIGCRFEKEGDCFS